MILNKMRHFGFATDKKATLVLSKSECKARQVSKQNMFLNDVFTGDEFHKMIYNCKCNRSGFLQL